MTLTELTTSRDEIPEPERADQAQRLQIDFLFLDLETCARCRGTNDSLEAALDKVGEQLAAIGVEVDVRKTKIESAQQAEELRFEISPTIRVNGRDAALELRGSSCGSEACADGCGDSIACRVWVHRGREYTVPPVAMIVDSILREVYGGTAVESDLAAEPYELPADLRRFFAETDEVAREDAAGECCPPAEQDSCCQSSEKAECCGSAGEGCGCR